MSPIIVVALFLAGGSSAFPGMLDGSGDYDVVDISEKPMHPIPPDEEVLDPIVSEDGYYPEDDDDYHTGLDTTVVAHDEGTPTSVRTLLVKSDPIEKPFRIDLLKQLDNDNISEERRNVNDTTDGSSDYGLAADVRMIDAEEKPANCSSYKKLSTQPQFINSTVSFIRKCCPRGQSLQAAHCKAGEPWGRFDVLPIVAQFYQDCIEDLEIQPPALGIVYGNPCIMERAMFRYGEDTKDALYVIQNGSLLVVNELVEEFEIFNHYCLDVEGESGTLVGFVCPSEIRMGKDIFKSQMVALALCLIFAIPLLLATAYFYVMIPEFNDIHGKALSLNCINFAFALLLESVFQHKTKGNGSNDDTIVLANYAEYYILATFFWLLVNCLNNCIHAWYFLPKGIQIKIKGEKRTFALYAAFAQLIPLVIILYHSESEDPNAPKHYFFIPIIVIIVLNIGSFFITFWGFQRVSDMLIQNFILRGRLSNTSEAANAMLAQLPDIRTADVEKVKYMTKYTAMLFMVMSGVWCITIATYYTTRTIPILYDILFGLQGILIFIIFICLPRPFRTVKRWFQQNEYCGCKEDPDAVNLRRRSGSYRQSNGGTKETIPLNNVKATVAATS
ncbi:probable G-protein coupled receptor Mth-like 14 [Toxorhynchites rutilus septentrionalis]|uniref:probable G-protein coupled receptor Mth-like 14 n=1 Tax=Toxorhynchites rutilus septentrionalis TaxID=329112 RepID=UPI002479AC91|nr:probable G-protein coupled receptor Mth-like 14 [Toxorhynchites rutilus septentrionalis]